MCIEDSTAMKAEMFLRGLWQKAVQWGVVSNDFANWDNLRTENSIPKNFHLQSIKHASACEIIIKKSYKAIARKQGEERG